MQTSRYWKIINVSSIIGLTGAIPVHYTTSKTGVIGFTRGLALSLGKYNICVNAILPGKIKLKHENQFDNEEMVSTTAKNNYFIPYK